MGICVEDETADAERESARISGRGEFMTKSFLFRLPSSATPSKRRGQPGRVGKKPNGKGMIKFAVERRIVVSIGLTRNISARTGALGLKTRKWELMRNPIRQRRNRLGAVWTLSKKQPVE
jgi:hypothetical protein